MSPLIVGAKFRTITLKIKTAEAIPRKIIVTKNSSVFKIIKANNISERLNKKESSNVVSCLLVYYKIYIYNIYHLF